MCYHAQLRDRIHGVTGAMGHPVNAEGRGRGRPWKAEGGREPTPLHRCRCNCGILSPLPRFPRRPLAFWFFVPQRLIFGALLGLCWRFVVPTVVPRAAPQLIRVLCGAYGCPHCLRGQCLRPDRTPFLSTFSTPHMDNLANHGSNEKRSSNQFDSVRQITDPMRSHRLALPRPAWARQWRPGSPIVGRGSS